MIGQTIQSVRKRKGIKQGVAATSAGISSSYLSQVEKERKTPTLETLRLIAQAIGTPLEVLFFLSLQESSPVKGPPVESLQQKAARLYGIPEEAASK